MTKISSLAVAASLVAGGASILAVSHEAAAKPKKAKAEAAAPAQPGVRQLSVSAAARPALKALETVVKAKDVAGYPAALAAAQAVATTPDEKFLVTSYQLEHARNNNDKAGQIAALEAAIATGALNATELPGNYQMLGVLSYDTGNWQKANDAFAKLLELKPGHRDTLVNLALVKMKLNKTSEALPLLNQAIASAKASGTPVPESWYRTVLQNYFENKSPEALALSREIYAAYPTPENWRNALIVYRDTVRADDNLNVDTLRLMRASKAMTAKGEYYALASQLNEAGLPGEAKKVLDEAVATNVGRPTDSSYRLLMTQVAGKVAEDQASLPGLETRAMAAPTGRLAFRTAEALLGYGDYAKAAALYRAAISKGGADLDPGLANMRLGIALALAGNKAEAQTAFKAVNGPRAALAAYWLDWLARRP